MKKLFASGFVAVLLSSHALAVGENNKTITTFALNDNAGNGYIRVLEPLTQPCNFGVISFSGNSQLSVLLAAKMAGKKIAFLNYDFNSATKECTLVSFEIE
ncbi:hypothetical protein CBP51_13935 [Cellvibrio mixtus]|uniref:Uncharacterized protein n=1 Tax=Cellvibrio mixtus TaxID=39650 RepID=A0A266Q388_9GAMM|nr:hypothetical protein [Cellvibrio mixtus]OZY84310.1 hypothetical protein CBP51_13935 [Cellvibrio mixtus]